MADLMKTFVPRDLSWYEQRFNHRVSIKQKGNVENFIRIKEWLMDDPNLWGVYREDWFDHFWVDSSNETVVHAFYFMTTEAVMWFRLAVDL
jgi:hypothetical protein